MKRFAVLALAMIMTASATGCCCGWPMGGYGYPGGWGGMSPMGGYQQNNCVVPPGTYPQTGSIYGNYNAYQTGVIQAAPGPVAIAPPVYYTGYPVTAMAPLESLPTY